MLAVGRLVRIVKTSGDKVISKLRFYNTFNYLGYEREVGDWPVVGELVVTGTVSEGLNGWYEALTVGLAV